MSTEKMAGNLREQLRKWVGRDGELVAEFYHDGVMLWVVKHNSELTNNLDEWSLLRGFGSIYVSVDKANATPEEVVKALADLLPTQSD